MFVTPDSDPKIHRTSISKPEALDLVVVGVKAAKMAAALGERAFGGAVRFNRHPGQGYKSGDELFVK